MAQNTKCLLALSLDCIWVAPDSKICIHHPGCSIHTHTCPWALESAMGSCSQGVVTWLEGVLQLSLFPGRWLCLVPEIKNDRVHLKVNLPLKSSWWKFISQQSTAFSAALSGIRPEPRPNPIQTWLHVYVSKWARREETRGGAPITWGNLSSY